VKACSDSSGCAIQSSNMGALTDLAWREPEGLPKAVFWRKGRSSQRLKKVDEEETGEGGRDQERSSGDFPQKGNSNLSKA